MPHNWSVSSFFSFSARSAMIAVAFDITPMTLIWQHHQISVNWVVEFLSHESKVLLLLFKILNILAEIQCFQMTLFNKYWGYCNHCWTCGKWGKRRLTSIVWHLLKMLLHTISNSNAPISMTPRHMAILAMLQISIKYSMSIIATYIKRKFFFFWELVQNYRNLQFGL